MYDPPDPSSFNALVWEIVRQIPPGCVSTYGQIASMIPPPEAVDPLRYRRVGARWVGSAMRLAPSGHPIPWHRVINSQGKISLPRGSAAAEEQRARLEMEGLVFDEQGRVDLNLVAWDGPEETWLRAHNLLPPSSLKKPSSKHTDQLNLC